MFFNQILYMVEQYPNPTLYIKPYYGIDNTLINVKDLIMRHYKDPRLKKFEGWPLERIFDYISRLPYHADPKNFEWLQAPYITMERGGDCDDKSILAGAIFQRLGIPYRMAVVSTIPDKSLHHIYLEVFVQGIWLPFDPTYNHNIIFQEKPYTLKRIYDWSCGPTKTFEINSNTVISHAMKIPCNVNLKTVPNFSRVKTLAGGNNLGAVKLAILEGDHEMTCGSCSCGGRCGCNKKITRKRARLMEYMNTINGSIGFDPGSILATAGAVVNFISSIFGTSQYQDAYNVWAAAERELVNAHRAWDSEGKPYGSPNFDKVVGSRALIAVLSRDFMNPPMGANVCTSGNRCGNRAEWAAIKPQVEQLAGAFAPFLKWVNWEGGEKKTIQWNDFGLDGLVRLYDQFKGKNGLYTQFASLTQQQQNNPNVPVLPTRKHSGITTTGTSGSGTTTLLVIGGIGAALYYFTQKKKRR